jgi:glycosyltransferase involved in cell wall biosynthesis
MRVVIPVLSLHRGGGCRVLIEAANQLTSRGHEVEIVMLEGEPIAWPVTCKVTRVPAITADVIPGGDIILPNFWPTVMPAVASGKGRVVRLSNGFEPLWVPNREEALKTYQLGLPVISLGPHLRQLVRDATGQDCFIAQPGVDSQVFRPTGHPRSATPVVFFIYRSEAHGYYYKGNRDFATAMEVVRRACPDVQVHLVATEAGGPGTPPVQLPIPFRLVEAGTDQDMAALYNQAHVYVLASWFEALSLPPLEAMACGTPVVITDCGGVRDYAEPGINCLMCPPRHPEIMAACILDVLQQPPLRDRLVAGGLKTASEWTWQRFGDQLEAALTAILRGAVEPPAGEVSS